MKKPAVLVGLAMSLALALPGDTEAAALIEVKKLTASDAQTFDLFGVSVAVAGDTVIVGAVLEEAGGNGAGAGAAYVFQRDQGGAGNWGEVTKLTASDAQAGDFFGGSVAVSGDTAVVGARSEDAEGNRAGAAYVFQRNQGGVDNWGEVTKLTASDAQAEDWFGFSVAVSGDTAVVGAVFESEGGNWGEVTKLTASDAQAGDRFGQSVAVSGETTVVGALAEDAGGGLYDDFGAAYVFQRDQGGAGNWGEVQKLTASDAQALDAFGGTVAVSGDTAVVGAWGEDAGGSQAGAAYVFQRDQGSAGNWGEVKKLTASDTQAFDQFGSSVAVSGDTAVVGTPTEDAGSSNAGAAYVFERKDPAGDTDGDGLPNSIDLDDDNDGCSDEQELGPDERLGGRRDPHNFWDFFDPNRDRAVGLLDFLAVLRHFNTAGDPSTLDPDGPEPPPGEYWALADRGGQAPGGDPWDELPANGSIGLADFLSVLRQFGHTCAGEQLVPGVTDTEITLGTHQPLSGTPWQVYSRIVDVTKAYFDFINQRQGGVHGRTINLIVKDDQNRPSLTVSVVRQLVEQNEVFAVLNGQGTYTHLTVVDYLLERGVPDMYMSTGSLEWVRNPAARPNIFGAIQNYIAEGMVLGQYVAETYPGMKLGIIFQNDEFGLHGLDGIKRGLSDDIEIVAEERYERSDPHINSQIDVMQSAGSDVVIIYDSPSDVPTAVRHARQDLDWDVPFVISGFSANEITIALAGTGVMEGTVGVSIFRQAGEGDHPAIIAHLEFLAEYTDGFGANFLTIYGQYVGELMVETLIRAGPDPTRAGLIKAAESITDFQCSVCLFTVNMSAADHDPAQSLVLSRVENNQWVNFGPLYDWEGVPPHDLTLDDLQMQPSP